MSRRSDQADHVWHLAQPLIIAAMNGISTRVLDDLSMNYTPTSLYVTAKFPQHLAEARERLLPVFTEAGWGFKEDLSNPRLIFSIPSTTTRNLRVVK